MSRSVGLTDTKIKSLAATGGRAEYPDDVVRGLRVRVGLSGSKTFTLRARFGGKPRNYSLGPYDPQRLTLAKARELARKMHADIKEGRDPAANLGREPGDDGRLAGLVEIYLQREVRGRKRTAAEIERTFKKDILPELGERLADTITTADVTKLVDKRQWRKGKSETPRQARMVHQLLSAFFNWALPRLDRLEVNPCAGAWKPPAAPPRERVLSDEEMRALWKVAANGGEFGKAVQLLMLTGQRRGEVVDALWSEFDLAAKSWILPAARSKNKKENRVHLSTPALAVLESIRRRKNVAFLFPAKGRDDAPISGFTQLWTKILKAVAAEIEVDAVPHFTMHDIRRTVATGMQRLGIRMEVTEAVLNHVSGSRAGIVGVYQRHDFLDEKRHALSAWAAELERIVAGKPFSNLVTHNG